MGTEKSEDLPRDRAGVNGRRGLRGRATATGCALGTDTGRTTRRWSPVASVTRTTMGIGASAGGLANQSSRSVEPSS